MPLLTTNPPTPTPTPSTSAVTNTPLYLSGALRDVIGEASHTEAAGVELANDISACLGIFLYDFLFYFRGMMVLVMWYEVSTCRGRRY